MLDRWQGTFCAGIFPHNIERGVLGGGGRLCCKRTLFCYFAQSVLLLIVYQEICKGYGRGGQLLIYSTFPIRALLFQVCLKGRGGGG